MYDVVFVNDFESKTNLHENVLNLGLRQSSSFRFDIGFKILLTVFQKKVQVLGCLRRFVEPHNVWTFKFHQNLDFSSNDFLILYVLQWDGLDC